MFALSNAASVQDSTGEVVSGVGVKGSRRGRFFEGDFVESTGAFFINLGLLKVDRREVFVGIGGEGGGRPTKVVDQFRHLVMVRHAVTLPLVISLTK